MFGLLRIHKATVCLAGKSDSAESKQRYHAAKMESSQSFSIDPPASDTTREDYDNFEVGTNACNEGTSFHNFEDDDPTLDTTSLTDESDESSSFSEGDSSQSSDSEDVDPEQANLQQENETSQSQEEEILYQGSKISKILSFVLIVSFVLKQNLRLLIDFTGVFREILHTRAPFDATMENYTSL